MLENIEDERIFVRGHERVQSNLGGVHFLIRVCGIGDADLEEVFKFANPE